MPEKFMEDDSVPVKWRLYGYLNGFWISGKTVFATNAHFAERFKCSDRHISRALEELEKDGLLTRNVNGFKRLILPGGMTPEVRGGRRGVSAQHDVGGHHISDSISDSKKDFVPKSTSSSKKEGSTELWDVDTDGTPVPPRPKKGNGYAKNQGVMVLLTKCMKLLSEELGVAVVASGKEYAAIEFAFKQGLSAEEVVLMVEDAIANGYAEKRNFSLSALLSGDQINKFRIEN